MGRIKLDLPEQFIFTTKMAIRITDINYGNHLGNDAVLGIIHEARLRFLNHFGYSEKSIEGMGIIMTDSVINYKNEGRYGDILEVSMNVADVSKRSFDMYYLMVKSDDHKEIARAKTGMMFYDYEQSKIGETPSGFAQKFTHRK